MDTVYLEKILYAYPVAIALGFGISGFVSYSKRQEPINNDPKRNRSVYKLIWHIQAILCANLLANITLALLAAAKTINYDVDSRVVQAQIASYLGLFLYFGAGLLPDPDDPFTPEKANWHMWILSICFEVTILALTGSSEEYSRTSSSLETSQLACGSLRIFLLLLMTGLFFWATHDNVQLSAENGLERAPLLRNSYVQKSLPGAPATKDAQTTGWLDYFVGFKKLFPYVWPSDSVKQQSLMVFCFGLMAAQRIINILVPYQLGILVDSLGRGRMPYKEIALYCIYRGLQGQQGVIGSIRAIIWIPISQSLFHRLSCAAFEHVLGLSLDFHLSKRVGEVIAALGKGGSLNTFLDGFAFQLFPMVFDLGIAAVYLFINFDAFYSIIVIGVMWSYIFATIYMAKYRGRARRKMATRERGMDASKTDAIMAYETVHHNCAVPNEVLKYEGLIRSFQRAEFAVLLSLNSLNALQNFIFILGVVLVTLLSAYQISIGLHKVSDFVTLITYFAQLHAPLAFFGSFYNQVQNNLVDSERMLALFNMAPDVQDAPNASELPECRGQVSFRNVSFAYDPRKPALKDVSFTVEPGTKTAIVGESGSGKSTILKLLFRFYHVNEGSIEIDGRDVSSVRVQSVRDHISIVPQDTILFNDSVMYNLKYARPQATEYEIHQACQTASIHHRILRFPEGYQTMVGERGLKLSGGEKQRVAIARAILKRPQIMLLDEATASLDSYTERQIQEELQTATKGRTTITIAHRLSTITQSGQILVLHDGRIVERGHHAELLAMGGRYRAMWEKQTTVQEREEGGDALI